MAKPKEKWTYCLNTQGRKVIELSVKYTPCHQTPAKTTQQQNKKETTFLKRNLTDFFNPLFPSGLDTANDDNKDYHQTNTNAWWWRITANRVWHVKVGLEIDKWWVHCVKFNSSTFHIRCETYPQRSRCHCDQLQNKTTGAEMYLFGDEWQVTWYHIILAQPSVTDLTTHRA